MSAYKVKGSFFASVITAATVKWARQFTDETQQSQWHLTRFSGTFTIAV